MKKILSAMLAGAMALSLASIPALANASGDAGRVAMAYGADYYVTDEDGVKIASTKIPVNVDSFLYNVNINEINPDQTVYFTLAEDGTVLDVKGGDTYAESGAGAVKGSELADNDLFKINVDKDGDGAKLVTLTQENNKRLDGQSVSRPGALKAVIKDTMTTDELKAKLDVTFTAKRDKKDANGKYIWKSGDKAETSITMWITNNKIGNDDNPSTGDNVVFEPEDNEENTLVWGDDRAALKFDADNDASKFYAKLSTKSNGDIYSTYGDPVGADLWFYDFVGNPSVPSTSRAILTLGIPWDTDEDYAPNPEDCFIYEIDADGELTDVTDKFTYSEDEEEIEGWSIKTRTLGSYVVSDTELDVEAAAASSSSNASSSEEGGKDVPQTGSTDMINVAVVAAVVAMAAAGAVAFKKVK